ncbi:DUF1835 domain-containing protein [Paenibacillus sp. N4]|uniref:DUF1835 domain-containing protein n=1 Tax=Paenibacillus vietnamensis TaxID=2590547 RepID=UPI001CD13C28|nr:DUF1835 domain-containing protein [Paenibacillus vietnamensis]MCA0756256.1 DUF1835 domain-containing protein [Paenibacillus vietnamensis]
MLHIVNGDSVGNKLKQGGMEGDVFVWREIYTEGPVFRRPEQPENSLARGQFLEQKLGIPLKEWLDGAEGLRRQLEELSHYDEVVLWFEHDLFDQTMLCRLLHGLAAQNLGNTKLQLLSIGEYPSIEPFHGLGQLSAEQLIGLAGTWQPVTAEQLLLGKRAWEAYTEESPGAILELLREDTSALPFLRDAFFLHLARFPSVQNGLGIVEQTTLDLLLSGVEQPLPLFRQTGDKLNLLGMGDLQYWASLRRLAQAEQPLIEIDGPFLGFHDNPEPFIRRQVTLTELGEKLARHQADWVALNGIDDWLGGVRLSGKAGVWRWDSEREKLVKGSGQV